MGYRLLKWIGDPPVVKADGWSVANWRHENARPIAMPRLARREITPYDEFKTRDGRKVFKPNGLSREYVWDVNLVNFVLEVDEADARIIMMRQPYEFADVTNVADPSTVHHSPIVLPPAGQKPNGLILPGKTEHNRRLAGL